MEQIAVVKSILKDGMAEIAVERDTACGAAHDCSHCNGCEKMMTRTHNVVVAFNDVGAGKGDVVKVSSENAAFFKTAAIVYLLPLVFAALGYAAAVFGGVPGEGLPVLCAFLGFAVGVLLGIAWDRHMKRVQGLKFHSVEIKKPCSGT